MRIISKIDRPKYSSLADRTMSPRDRSADLNIEGFIDAMLNIVEGCGNSFCIKLNDTEKNLINKILDLDRQSYEVKPLSLKTPTPLEILIKREAKEKRAKIAAIVQARNREEAIVKETTYASRKDIDDAKARSLSMKGDVQAKKLNTRIGEPVSLHDLMGDNKFIEESMKHSNIKTAVASEEGWDMKTMNAPKVSDNAEHTTANSSLESGDKPSKKTSRRRRKESK